MYVSSGSIGIRYFDGQCKQTYPNQILVGDEGWDWCSNIMKSTDDHPWVTYRLPNKAMSLRGYSVRNGCCHRHCCCDPGTDRDLDIHCCCDLYNFSLQGSNDKKTWKTIHRVEKDRQFYNCQLKTYEFDITRPFNFIRFFMDEEYPHCPKCIQINQIEL